MRRYLLDTTPVSAIVTGHRDAVALVTPWMRQHEAATSILVYGEVYEGLQGRPRFAERHAQLITLLAEIIPYYPTYPIMRHYAELRRQLRRPFGPGLIGDVDTLIAATALFHDLTLVTTDEDFTRIPGLHMLLLDRLTMQPRSPGEPSR